VAGAVPDSATVYVDDITVPPDAWTETKTRIGALGLGFSREKTVSFNLPGVPDAPPAPDGHHVLGVPTGEIEVSRRVRALQRICESLSKHDALTMAAGGLFARAHYDLATGNAATIAALRAIVATVCAAAGLDPDTDLPVDLDSARRNVVLATLLRLLVLRFRGAWELFETSDDAWFAMARGYFLAAGYSVGPGRQVISPQGAPLVEMPKKLLTRLANATRKNRNALARAAGRPPPETNIITQNLLAWGARPAMSDAQVLTASELRKDDTARLREFAGSDSCALCASPIGPHHPLLCSTVSNRGDAHDTLVNAMASALRTNPEISVTANKNFKASKATRKHQFRPDIEVIDTQQLVEVKTVNRDVYGSGRCSR
jgi:hypothetical protein